MKRRPLIALLACVAFLVTGAAWAAQQETETFHKAVPLPSGGSVSLHNFSGKVHIVGTDGNQVVIDAVRQGTRERLGRIKLEVETSGSTVKIEANRRDPSWSSWRGDNVVKTEFEIQMPRSAALEVNVFSSPVTVAGITGRIEVDGFSSDVAIERAAAPVKVKTFSGGINVQVVAETVRPDLDLHTFSGDIDVRMPASVSAEVDFDSFSGDLDSDVPMTLRSKSRRSFRAQLNGGTPGPGGALRLKTFSGDVRLLK